MGANLADLVADAAARRPDHPAILGAGRTTTWAVLDRMVHALAGGLTARRLGRGDRVALILGNSIEFVTSYFGTLRAGLVAVPINTSYTATEIRELLQSSGAKVAICDSRTAAAVREAVGDDNLVVEVGTSEWRRLTVGSTAPPSEETDAESLAVLIYTSGTSGKPRGAMLTHRALQANLDQLSALHDPAPMHEDDVALIVLPMFHIYGLNATLGMVVKHAACAVLTDRFDPRAALDLVRDHNVTNIAGAPAMYIAWSGDPVLTQRLRNVRLLNSGAAPLSPAVYEQFLTAGHPIWEGYGMTEASPVISSALATGEPKAGFVGHSIPGVDVMIVDSHGHEITTTDPGEIVVRGANLFSGYWPDGADGPGPGGWWHTGDVAITDDEGNIQLVDRRGDVIIVSGFNVYPREIESALSRHPSVAEVAVFGVAHPYTGEAVKALVVPAADAELTKEELVEWGSKRLARFKNPTIVELVAELPHSITGKVQKGRLKAASAEQAVPGGSSV